MEAGDYGQRVQTRSRDEVGQLAVAFNRMSGELEDLERLRRDLVANVSHELRDADLGVARAPGEPARRRRASRSRNAPGDARPDRTTRAPGRPAAGAVAPGIRGRADGPRARRPVTARRARALGDRRHAGPPRRRARRGTSEGSASGVRRRRTRAPGPVQPARQRRAIHAVGWPGDGARLDPERIRRRRGRRHGSRHRVRASAACVRALLPRRSRTLARRGRDRHRPGDRAFGRRGPRGPHLGREPAGQGQRVHVRAPGRRRAESETTSETPRRSR